MQPNWTIWLWICNGSWWISSPSSPIIRFFKCGACNTVTQQSTGTVNNIVIERYAEQRVKAYTMRELHLEMVANNIGTPSSRPGIIDKLVNRRKYLRWIFYMCVVVVVCYHDNSNKCCPIWLIFCQIYVVISFVLCIHFCDFFCSFFYFLCFLRIYWLHGLCYPECGRLSLLHGFGIGRVFESPNRGESSRRCSFERFKGKFFFVNTQKSFCSIGAHFA